MDLDQLRAFERIVREGSFSRAAWALDITQPTISARIQALEAEVGGPLLVRGRRLELTELGQSFLPYARRAINVVAEGIEAARLARAGQRGRLAVGTLPSYAGGFLASTIARFYSTHPHTDLFVRTGHSEEITAMLRDGMIKVGLISWPFFNTDLTPLLRIREPLILVAAAGHALAQAGAATMDEAQRMSEPFLLVRWGPAMTPVVARIDEQGAPVIEVPFDTVKHLLRRGIGAAFLTRALIADDLASGRLVEISVRDLPPMFRESVLVRLSRGGDLPLAAADFVAMLRDEAGPLVVE